jgi:hypothetical protein
MIWSWSTYPFGEEGDIYSPWGENDSLGQILGFRFNSRLDRKFPVEIPVETKNQTRDFQFKPSLGPRPNQASPKTHLGLAELVRSKVRLKPKISGWISGGIFGQTGN